MEWKVRYIDYSKQYRKIRSELLSLIDQVLSRGDVMLRGQLRDFESNLAAFLGTSYAVGTSNCTDALQMVLRCAGVGQGDEVITVSHTFVATAAAIHHAGATPVLVDIGEDHNMDVSKLENAMTRRTKAIIPVHLNGRLCEMDRIGEIAADRNLIVIEDTAQALGASLKGKKGGQWGLAGCFSFYPAKLLGAYGDAGAVVTNSRVMADAVRAMRDHGRLANGGLSGWSFNARLDNIHAAILDLKLRMVPDWIQRRREIARIYMENLADVQELLLPSTRDDGGHYDVFQNFEIEAEDRDRLREFLEEGGVETMLPWGGKGIHHHGSLGLTHFSLPRTDLLFKRALMLPLHCELEDDQVAHVCGCIKAFYRKASSRVSMSQDAATGR